ncbi:MAG: hypothetical protein JXA42_09100 [Anaerolineales bacterium]|nr:hypothetical protein [Anaerolineales bacterium]
MNDRIAINDLVHYLARWEKRRRFVQCVSWGPRGLAAGLAAGLLLAISSRLAPLLSVRWIITSSLLAGLAGVIVTLLLVWLRPKTTLEKARFFDRQFELKERISTAIEIGGGELMPPPDWMARDQMADAFTAAKKVEAALYIPFRFVFRDWAPALLMIVLTTAAIWAPNPMQNVLAERLAVRQAIEEQVEEIEAIREEIAADPELSEDDKQQLEEILGGAVEKLEQRNLTQEEALAEITAAEERLREIGNSAENGIQGLRQAGQAMQDSPVTGDLAEALQNLDLETAAEILEDLSNELGKSLTREEELELAQQLAEAAGEMADTNPELAGQLAEAADAINAGDIQAARASLAQASQTTGQTGQQMAAGRAAQRAAGQMQAGGQQIAQAGGGNSGSQAASGQGGSGSQSSSGQSSSGGMSQGGSGRGESDGQAAGGTASDMDTGNGPGDGGLRSFEQIYAPQRLGGEGGPEMELDTGGDPDELVRELGSNPEIGESTIPYNQVYASYADSASQALQDQRIPLGLRGYVRDYFSSLQP